MNSEEDYIGDKADTDNNEELKIFYCSHCGAKIGGLVVARYEWSASPGMTVKNEWVLCSCCSQGTSLNGFDEVTTN